MEEKRGRGRAGEPGGAEAGMDELARAAREGRWMDVERLLSTSDPLAADGEGFTALMRASRAGCERSVALLLPVSDPMARNKAGSTALIEAAKWGNAPCCALLAAKVGSEGRSPNGKSALDCALERGALPEALALARAARRVNADRRGVSELMRAGDMMGEAGKRAGMGQAAGEDLALELLRALVAELSAKPGAESVDMNGRDAVMRAAWAGQCGPVKALLPWLGSSRLDVQGLNAAALAHRAGHKEVAALIEGFDSDRGRKSGLGAL